MLCRDQATLMPVLAPLPRHAMYKMGGSWVYVAHPGFDLRGIRTNRGIEKFAQMGIFRQAGCDDLPVLLAIFEHGLIREHVLVRSGIIIFAGGRCVAHFVREMVPARSDRFSFRAHR